MVLPLTCKLLFHETPGSCLAARLQAGGPVLSFSLPQTVPGCSLLPDSGCRLGWLCAAKQERCSNL